jgi:hypothetical protein
MKKKIVTPKSGDPFDAAYHEALSATLADEWSSREDDEAFRDLGSGSSLSTTDCC